MQKVRRILECFTLDDPDLGLQELIRRTGLPASTCQRLVQSLVAEGFLDKDGDVYRVGLGLVRWAAPGTYGMELVKSTRSALDQLRDEANETAYLQVRDGPHRTIISLAEVRHIVVRRFMVGMVMPLHAGSGGKVFLALDEDAWRNALEYGLRSTETNRVVDVETLEREVAEVRSNGYAISFEERDAGAGSVSAPVFGVDGSILAVIGIGAPIQRFDRSTAIRLAPLVVAAGRRASELLGYRIGT